VFRALGKDLHIASVSMRSLLKNSMCHVYFYGTSFQNVVVQD